MSILTDDGYEVVSARDGREVYRLLQSDADFKGAVLSLAMPYLDGAELISYMRTEKRLMRIPVMLITPETHTKGYVDGLAMGATVLLPKPFTKAGLQRALRMMLHTEIEGEEGSKPSAETLAFQKSLLEAQTEASIDGILVVSSDGEILSFNHRFVEIWNVPAPALEGRSDKVALKAVLTLLQNPKEFLARIEYLYQHPHEKSREEIQLNDGRILDRYSAPVIHTSGQLYGRVWFFRDITEQKRIESELQKRDSELIEAQRIAQLGNWEWDITNDRTKWSEGLCSIYGIHARELAPNYEGYLSRVHPDDREYVTQEIEKVLREGRGCSYEHRIVRPDNAVRHHHVIVRVEVDNKGHPIRLFGTAQDVSEQVELQTNLAERVKELEAAILQRERAEQAMRDLALHDDLTGLYNNRGFYALAEHQLKSIHRLGVSSLLIYADIDGLKKINDTFGHTEGSLAIAKTADILRQTFRASDIIGRVGGDEFAIMAQAVSIQDMDTITAHLQENLLTHNEQSNRGYQLALSLGAVNIDPDTDSSLDQLIAQADKMMYDQKRRKNIPFMLTDHATIDHQHRSSLSQIVSKLP